MTENQLNTALNEALENYSKEIRSIYKEGSREQATEHDINELARQTFYVLDEFRKAIVKYLEER